MKNVEERFGVGRLFSLTHEAVIGADLASETIVLWNPSAERVFGYAADEAIGMRLDQLVPDTLRPQHHAGIAGYRNGNDVRLVGTGTVEVPAFTKDGQELTVALSLTAIPDEEARRYVVAVIRDVTAQRRAEHELTRANEAMQEFVASASHDLRTPLTSVLGYARLLEEDANLTPAHRRQFAAAILRAGNQASKLVDDLLTVSKIQAGMVDTRSEVLQVEAAVRTAASDASLEVAVDVAAGLELYADPDHVCRMLVNLITNADRYGAGTIRVSATRDGDVVVLRVCDEGEPIPDDFQPRLFEKFARAATARAAGGTGLGLSIVKGLAQANGGDAFFERNGSSNCFGVRLPQAPR